LVGRVAVRELPAQRVASLVYRGETDYLPAYRAMRTWIARSELAITGPKREVFLRSPGSSVTAASSPATGCAAACCPTPAATGCSSAAMARSSKTRASRYRPTTARLIAMSYRGVRHSAPEVVAGMARGEPVEPTDYYLRTAPFYETSAPRYAWINTIVSIGVGRRIPTGVSYDVFEIL
jgi:hypothetical protein